MRTIRNFRITLLSAIMCMAAGIVNAQDTTDKEAKKAEQKQKKAEQFAENLTAIKSAVNDSTFVIEANTLRGRHTFSQFVMPSTNFIKVNGKQAVIQTANSSAIGYNGLGGITIDGNIRKYEVFEEEHGVRVLIQLSSFATGFSTINVSVNASGHATASLSTGYGGYITYSGDFYSLDDSAAFEGMSIL